MDAQVLALIRGQVGAIILATIFLFIGLAACAVAAIHGRGGVRALVWQGIFSAMYGTRILAQSPAGLSIFPPSVRAIHEDLVWVITYVMVIPAILFWADISLGALRHFLQITLVVSAVIAAGGVSSDLIARSPYKFLPYNNMLGISLVVVLASVTAVPSLAKKFLVVQSRILGAGTVAFAIAALYTNSEHFLKLPDLPALEPLSFLVFIAALGYVAVERVFASERRLLSIDSELAIAREIQTSILPHSVPALAGLRVAAAYHPMTAVAGDFYEFVPVDQKRAGFLIADVSGHGVPAALIAAMIKVAMQSVVSQADDPPEVLRGLNRALAGQLRGQFVTAAYLWIDTQNRKALYSAAGHPPLFRCGDGAFEQIASNGMPIGLGGDSDYPVVELPVKPGDRFVLCTDGVTEPENASGEFFGDNKFEQVLRNNRLLSAQEFSNQLLAEIRRWQPASTAQQDDITLIVIDVV